MYFAHHYPFPRRLNVSSCHRTCSIWSSTFHNRVRNAVNNNSLEAIIIGCCTWFIPDNDVTFPPPSLLLPWAFATFRLRSSRGQSQRRRRRRRADDTTENEWMQTSTESFTSLGIDFEVYALGNIRENAHLWSIMSDRLHVNLQLASHNFLLGQRIPQLTQPSPDPNKIQRFGTDTRVK
jgi:hypothetical protein